MSIPKFFFLLLQCVLLTSCLHAQEHLADVDKTISTYLERINYWGEVFKTPTDYNDSLVAANDKLMAYIRKACEDPATLTTPFEKAQGNGLMIASAEDSALRFYSWDTWMDPSLHCFNALAQYNTAGGLKVNVLTNVSNLYKRGDPGAYFTDVTTITTGSGKKVYLVTDCSIAGENKGYEVKAYAIEKDSLITIPFFKTGNNVTKSIDYAYKEVYSGDTAGGYHGQFNSLHFSADKTKLFLPIISNTGTMSDKYYIYKFNGEMFVYRKKGDDKHDDVIK